MGRFSNPTPQYLDDNGVTLPGGLLYFYETGTTTPKATYSDSALTVANTNPVELDAAGRIPEIFASVEEEFRVVLKDADGNTIWTRDNVQFPDAAELVSLINQLQAQIDDIAIETSLSLSSVINPSCDASGQNAATMSGSWQEGTVPGTWGRVTGTVSAGTLIQGTLAGLGSVESQALANDVTGDSSSVVEFATRIFSADAYRYVNKTASFSALIRQESGLTATVTAGIYTCDSQDLFTNITLVSQATSSAASSTNTTVELAGVAMGDCSNGFVVIVKIAPGASFTTKDFYITDWNIAQSSTVQDYAPEVAAIRQLQAYFDSLTGQIAFFERTTAPFGWVRQMGGTIGNTGSGASERANPDCRRLFVQRWNTFSDSLAPVSGGRGASAEADWAAGKTIGLFNDRGRYPRAWNNTGSGIDASRAIGSAQDDSNKAHTHNIAIDGGADDVIVDAFGTGDPSKEGRGFNSGTVTTNTAVLTTSSGTESTPYNRAYILCVHL